MSKHPILDLPMQENDAGAATIRDYLKKLLSYLINSGEAFSGKRPFGNSGWEWDMHMPLVKAGLVKGQLDEDGNIIRHESDDANVLIISAINDL